MTEPNPAAGAHDPDGPFVVELVVSGRELPVAAGQSIVEALRDAGIDVATSCEQGICGTCLTKVVAGVPDHRDFYLSAEEQEAGEQCLPCCARSRTPRLALEL